MIQSSIVVGPVISAVVEARVPSQNQASNRLRSEGSQTPRAAGVSMAYLGPVIMSIGCFAVIASVVVVCEVRDRMLDLFDKLGGLCAIGGSRRLRRLGRGGGCGFAKVRSQQRGLPRFSRLTSTDDDDVHPFRHDLLAFISAPCSPCAVTVPPNYFRQTTNMTNETQFSTIELEEALPVCRFPLPVSELFVQPEEETVAMAGIDESLTTRQENATARESAVMIRDLRSRCNTSVFVDTDQSTVKSTPLTYDEVQIHSCDRRTTSLTSLADSLEARFSAASGISSATADCGIHSLMAIHADKASIALPVESSKAIVNSCDTHGGCAELPSQDSDEVNSDSSSYYRDYVTSDSDLSTVNEVECEFASSSSSFGREDDQNSQRHNFIRQITVSVENQDLAINRSSSAGSEYRSVTVDSVAIDIPPEGAVTDYVSDVSSVENAANGQCGLICAEHVDEVTSSTYLGVTSASDGQAHNAPHSSSTKVVDRVAVARSVVPDSMKIIGENTVRARRLSHERGPLSLYQLQMNSASSTPVEAVPRNMTSSLNGKRTAECRMALVEVPTTSRPRYQLSSGSWSSVPVQKSVRRQPMKMSLPPASHSAVAIDDVNGSLSTLRRVRAQVTTTGVSITRDGKSDN